MKPRRMTLGAALALTLVAPAGAGAVAVKSFSCEMAHTADEKAVCRSPWLRRLDSIMADQYAALKAYLRRRRPARPDWAARWEGRLRDGQRVFVAARARCAAQEACIGALYEQRIMELVRLWRELLR